MVNEHLAVYLNDHLAGSVAALELIEYLRAARAGTALEAFFAELHTDVMADRQELEALMARLHIAESRRRKATAWLAEKATQLKLQLDDPAGGTLRLLEGLEALAVGIEGKRGLWQALAAVAEDEPELQGNDYPRLIQRAEEQHRRVEVARLQAAKAAFRATS
jgi:hypothetical protein